jgi:hypothetical protein
MDLQEVRLSDAARTPDWIATDYDNQATPSAYMTTTSTASPSAFVTLFNVEDSNYAPTTAVMLRRGEWFNSSGIRQPFSF